MTGRQVGRTGQVEQQNRTARTGLREYGCQDRVASTGRRGMPGKDSQNRIASTG
jgi:hypothetical protein